jgi:hypothetical protein
MVTIINGQSNRRLLKKLAVDQMEYIQEAAGYYVDY